MSSSKQINTKQILEPIGACCKLILLNFKQDGTKIKICDHVIEIDEPSYLLGILPTQGISRTFNSFSREDTCILYSLILQYIEMNILPTLKTTESEYQRRSSETYRDLIILAQYMCIGLKKLQETYDFDSITFSLQLFINMLTDAIENDFNTNKLPPKFNKIDTDLFDTDKINEIWSEDEIRHLCQLFTDAFSFRSNGNEKMSEHLLTAVTAILSEKDKTFRELLRKRL